MNIRIISPSGAIESLFIEGAKQHLLSLGWNITEGQYARGKSGRFAATDAQRLSDLRDALADPSVDVILCSRGGYGMQRIIDRVGTITKPIIGFSDITELHMLAGLNAQPSLHAIMCKHMAQHETKDDVFAQTIAAIEGQPLHYNVAAHPLNRPGTAEGVLLGGNLSVIYGLQGTPYDLNSIIRSSNITKPLLVLEDIGERHYHIDRMMNNLRLSGVLEQIGGLIVGQFTDCEDDESMGETLYETIARYTQPYNYPVLFNFPTGHVEHNMPLWLNKKAELIVNTDGGMLRQD